MQGHDRFRAQSQPQKSRAGTSDDEPFIPLHKLKEKKQKTDDPVTFRVLRAINKRRTIIIVVVLAILVGFFAYKYFNTSSELQKANDFTNNSDQLAQAIQNEVSKYISDLPKETPKLDTINDPSAAGGSTLFKDAQKGDKVLYYESSGKVLIYRPSTKQVVIYTYVSPSQTPSTQDQGSTNTPTTNNSNTSGTTGSDSSAKVIPTPDSNN